MFRRAAAEYRRGRHYDQGGQGAEEEGGGQMSVSYALVIQTPYRPLLIAQLVTHCALFFVLLVSYGACAHTNVYDTTFPA